MLQNLSLKQKILSSFLLTVCVMLVVSGYTFIGLGKVVTNSDEAQQAGALATILA